MVLWSCLCCPYFFMPIFPPPDLFMTQDYKHCDRLKDFCLSPVPSYFLNTTKFFAPKLGKWVAIMRMGNFTAFYSSSLWPRWNPATPLGLLTLVLIVHCFCFFLFPLGEPRKNPLILITLMTVLAFTGVFWGSLTAKMLPIVHVFNYTPLPSWVCRAD